MRATLGSPVSLLSFLVALLAAAPAAALTQPNGTPIPSQMGCNGGQPTGLASVFACECLEAGVCNIGAVCPSPDSCDDGLNGTCETTLSHVFNDNTCIPSNLAGLDPWAEAEVLPETFRPVCGLTFTVVSRGTAMFHDAFGWYNVVGSGPPALEDLHPMLGCDDPAGTEVVLDVGTHPDYLGGEIGFFLATPESHTASGTCAGGDCCATLSRIAAGEGYLYYSQRGYNPDEAGSDSYIHLIIYDSHIMEHAFYFAWEDIYGGSNNDFTDIVTRVSGVDCSGAGAACDTGGQGICDHGVTTCAGGALTCLQVFQPEGERCDGLDNDCDGVVDDGATCGGTDVCQHGRCVEHCELSAEFDCPPDMLCDGSTGFCVDPLCEPVTCDADQVCRAGTCVSSCEGIVCPHGQVCWMDVCLDPCDGLACDPGEVCALGLCVPGCHLCGGLVCGPDLLCDDATGSCVDPSCPAGCPDGTFCRDGACVDACEGAVCPGLLVCHDGRCIEPGSDWPDAGPPPGADGGLGGDGGVTAADGGGGCGCARASASATEQASLPFAPVLLLGMGLIFARRRR